MANGPMIFPLDNGPRTEEPQRPSAAQPQQQVQAQTPASAPTQNAPTVDFSTDTRRDLALRFRDASQDATLANQGLQEVLVDGANHLQRLDQMATIVQDTALADAQTGLGEVLDAYDKMVEIQASPFISEIKGIFNPEYRRSYQRARMERGHAYTQAAQARQQRMQVVAEAQRRQVLDQVALQTQYAGAAQQNLTNISTEASMLKTVIDAEVARFDMALSGLSMDETAQMLKTKNFRGFPAGMVEDAHANKVKQEMAARQAVETFKATQLDNTAQSLTNFQNAKKELLGSLSVYDLTEIRDEAAKPENRGVFVDPSGIPITLREAEAALLAADEERYTRVEKQAGLMMVDQYGQMDLDNTMTYLERWTGMIDPIHGVVGEMKLDANGQPIPLSNLNLDLLPPPAAAAAKRIQVMVPYVSSGTPEQKSGMLAQIANEVEVIKKAAEEDIKNFPKEQQGAVREFRSTGRIRNQQEVAGTIANTLTNPQGLVLNSYVQPLVTALGEGFSRLDDERFGTDSFSAAELQDAQRQGVNLADFLASKSTGKPNDVEKLRITMRGLKAPPQSYILGPMTTDLYSSVMRELAAENSAWAEYVETTGAGLPRVGVHRNPTTGAPQFNAQELIQKLAARPNDGDAMVNALYDALMTAAPAFAQEALTPQDHVTAAYLGFANLDTVTGTIALQRRIQHITEWKMGVADQEQQVIQASARNADEFANAMSPFGLLPPILEGTARMVTPPGTISNKHRPQQPAKPGDFDYYHTMTAIYGSGSQQGSE